MPWSERKPKLPSTKEAPVSVAACRAPTSATSYAVPIFGIARDFDVPLPNFPPLRRRTIHSRVHSNASISCRQRRGGHVLDFSLSEQLALLETTAWPV